MTKKKLEKVQKRIEKDYQKIVEVMLELDKTDIINDAYRLAHYNEVADFFDCIDYEYPPFEEDVFDHILKYDGNAIQRVWESWLEYCHPERYNFFTYEDLVGIISYAFWN